jgi:hypothetical protein
VVAEQKWLSASERHIESEDKNEDEKLERKGVIISETEAMCRKYEEELYKEWRRCISPHKQSLNANLHTQAEWDAKVVIWNRHVRDPQTVKPLNTHGIHRVEALGILVHPPDNR